MTMVTCPTIRYHPAVVAQKAATTGLLSDGCFTLGLGAGERLNEHVVGRGWPSASVRHEMLAEAVEIIRRLWEGGYVDHRGTHFAVEDARLYDLPDTPVPIAVAVSGSESVQLAAHLGDGIVATEPDADLVDEFCRAHPGGGSTWNQIPMCWGADADETLERAHHSFRWAALGWKVQAELPNPVSFDAPLGAGPARGPALDDPDEPRRAALRGRGREGRGCRYDNIALLQIGEDQDGFFRFWQDELGPALRERNG
jgi:G6PDH family F420-dependent oxidoreductase